jgi:Tol biopolymer transport system component
MIKLMNADGSNLRDLAQGSRPDWSPDGTQIAFDRLDPSRCLFDMFCPVEIYVMAADGSQVRKLIGSSNASDQLTSPAWSPDGSRIAYSRRCCFLGPSVSGIYAVRPAGSVLQPIYQGAIGGGPIWSPDGTTIAFAAMRTDGITELTLIAQGARGTIASSPDSEYPEAWK